MRKTKIDFIGNRKKYFTISIVLLLIIALATIIFGVDMDIRFRGGTMMDYSYAGEEDAIDLDEVETIAEDILDASVSVEYKYSRVTSKHGFQITLVDNESVSSDLQGTLDTSLLETFSEQGIEQISVTSVNPTMGMEFFRKCLVAILLGAALMVLYIGIRFRKIGGVSAGLFAVVALVHDVIIVFGTFVIFGMPLDDSFIAVILTILGYSLNSTIVVYDRIRENSRLYKRTKPLAEIVNLSINQTLTRCIYSSATTMTVMLIVCIVCVASGVTSILSFALPIMLGILSGAFSSTCLASEMWVVWKNRKKKKA